MATDTTITYKASSEYRQNEGKPEIKLKIATSNSMYIIHSALVKQLATKRQGTAHSKTRSEVRGGGRKPWKQKGTGKARAGSIRSPLWKGGGVTFGPRTRNYISKINTKERKLAIRTLLYNKAPHILVISNEEIFLAKPSTQLLLDKIQNLNLDLNKRILIIVDNKDKTLYLSHRNLQNIDIIQANQINIIALLNAEQILITSTSLKQIEEVYND
uniref:Large ribosomal subunit protein uL4c n=1 Tax=Sheathia arcuata TaxID=340433 RepID=A0A3G1I939_9FLOR|nr:50S ribosomal protein L4 [Sheathia arcuata]ART65453.1 50S ribosomal protein L4 [Sheathia arcuata]